MALFSLATLNSSCNSNPQPSGPPKVTIFGGGGSGALVNAIVSLDSSSIIAFDILDPGSGYNEEPFVYIEDKSGRGRGAKAKAKIRKKLKKIGISTATGGLVGIGTTELIEDYELDSLTVLAPGDGYLTGPDGSLCGDGFVWKEPDEGYVIRNTGEYQVVQINRPIDLNPGDIYYPPTGLPREIKDSETITLGFEVVTPPTPNVIGNPYEVVLSIENVVVLDSGFGYRPEDKIIVTPDNGAILEPVINSQGQITSVNIVNGGYGFDDIPEIKTNSMSGFNAQMMPTFKVTRLNEDTALNIPKDATIITVIDCVGKF